MPLQVAPVLTIGPLFAAHCCNGCEIKGLALRDDPLHGPMHLKLSATCDLPMNLNAGT